MMYWQGNLVSHPYLFDGQYGNSFLITQLPAAVGGVLGAHLRPEELWNIDTKMDDGKPALGKLVVSRWNQCTTGASTADTVNARYLLDPPSHAMSNRCVGVFRNAF
jgi:hypothetical protein